MPEHGGNEPTRFGWRYDPDDHTIDLEVYTYGRVNTSCSCHPEYETREHTSYHYIPADEIAANADDPNDYWVFETTPFYGALEAKVESDKQAAAAKAAAEAAARADAQRRAAEQRERDELARLQSKYGN